MDPYATLGVPPDADLDTIKSVYRQLARAFHPDVNAAPDAVAHFREITEAFMLLSDPKRRALCDRRRRRRGTQTDSEIDVRVAGISLGGLVGISVRTRVRPLFADDLDEDERPLPAD